MQARSLSLRLPQFDVDHDLTLLGELDRVVGQVDQDLAQSQGIADEHRGNMRVPLEQQFQALLLGLDVGDRGQVVQHPVDVEIDRFHVQPAGLDLGEIQDVVDDAEQGFGRAVDLGKVISLVCP